MNRKSGSGSGPFLMEMLVVVGFFIICASICVMVFVKADRISKNAGDINQAVIKAQTLAEELKGGLELPWRDTFPDRNFLNYLQSADQEEPGGLAWKTESSDQEGEQDIHVLYWDKNWNLIEDDEKLEYLGVIRRRTADDMEETDILILNYGSGRERGNVLFRLKTEIYRKP